MTNSKSDRGSVAEALKQLWEQHRDEIFRRIDTIEEAIAALMEDDLDDDLRERAMNDAHKLAGSLGTFGYGEGTRQARDIERILEGEAPAPEEAVRLSELIVGLRHSIEDQPASEDGEADTGEDTEPSPVARPITLISSDEELIDRLEVDLAGFGFAVTAYASLPEEGPNPVTVVVDLTDVDPGSYEARLSELPDASLVAVILDSYDLEHRLAATKAGGRLVFRRSMGSAGMARALHEALNEERLGDATVLAVDDDESMGALVKGVLEARGLRVESLQDPTEFLDVLDRMAPDLVILDQTMPNVSGTDLCRLLRSDPERATLPVIFLTGSEDPEVLSEVFEAGADDFVRKPVTGPALIHRVFNRLERVRLLRRMSETDSLTGLPNRATATPAISSLIGLARSNDEPLSFAFVDLNGIAKINARYGYSAGDLPMRRLARLLETEFDEQAVVTRWSGVTFGLACYGSTADDLQHTLSSLGDELAGQPFDTESGDSFRCTFSAGIAQYPADGEDLRELVRAANRALEEATDEGPGTVWTTTSGSNDGGATERVEVLMVDDDRPIAELVVQSLQTRGISARWIGDGKEALEALVGRPPQISARVLLLDVGLPGLDGLTVLRKLAMEGLTDRTRVMMLTARTAESEVLRALELGAFDHMSKPFSVPILLHKIRIALES